MSALTIRVSESLRKDLEELSRQQHRPLSDMAREALRRHVAREKLELMRREIRPHAEAMGLYSDEDIFKALA